MRKSDIWAVIPVAGSGSRLRPHTHTRPKPLLYVAGQPILGHILDRLTELGIRRMVLVVGYMGEQIVEYVKQRATFEVVESVKQKDLLGLGHAIGLTEPIVGENPMLMVYGDTIFQADLMPVLACEADCMLGVKRVEDPCRFGVVVEEDGEVTRLIEKPEVFVSDQAIVGVNFVRASGMLFRCLEQLMQEDRRNRGEFQLTDALQLMIGQGARLVTFPVEEWFDCGTQEALLWTNRHLLERAPGPTHAEDTVVIRPVYIDPTALVKRSIVGPYVSVGAGAKIDSVIAKNSIIGSEVVVENMLIENTLIGFQAVVKGRTNRLNVGDMSEIIQ
jgi:glucose-1-phosphate thymidylyltransferase